MPKDLKELFTMFENSEFVNGIDLTQIELEEISSFQVYGEIENTI